MPFWSANSYFYFKITFSRDPSLTTSYQAGVSEWPCYVLPHILYISPALHFTHCIIIVCLWFVCLHLPHVINSEHCEERVTKIPVSIKVYFPHSICSIHIFEWKDFKKFSVSIHLISSHSTYKSALHIMDAQYILTSGSKLRTCGNSWRHFWLSLLASSE